MMSPREINRQTAFIGDLLIDSQNRLVSFERQSADQVEWSTNSSDFKLNFDSFRIIANDVVAPGQKKHFTMLTDFGTLMQREVAAIWKQLLPATFVKIHMRAG